MAVQININSGGEEENINVKIDVPPGIFEPIKNLAQLVDASKEVFKNLRELKKKPDDTAGGEDV